MAADKAKLCIERYEEIVGRLSIGATDGRTETLQESAK